LGVSLAQGKPVSAAVRYGCAAGALATTRPGAQAAMPTAADVREFVPGLLD
jgi:ribokinase